MTGKSKPLHEVIDSLAELGRQRLESERDSIPIHADDGRVIGHVRRGVFEKSIDARKHLLRNPRAICFDQRSLKEADEAGAAEVAVFDRSSGRTYRAPLSLIRAKGFLIDRAGRQCCIRLENFRRDDQPEQLRLFSEDE